MTKSLLLGAGASYELGMPLVWELTGEFKKWLTPDKLKSFNQKWKSQGEGWSNSTVDQLIELLSNNSMHYESLIGAIETEIKRERNGPKFQELHGVRKWLIDTIYHLFYFHQIKNEAYIRSGLPDFIGIKKLAEESKPLWVFTLNHDINFEIIASYFNIPIKGGFKSIISLPRISKSGSPLGRLSFEYLSRSDLDKNNFHFFKQGEYGINLVKLHGSLDIFAQGDDLNLLKILPKDKNVTDYINSLKQANEELIFVPRTKVTNEIAYADDNGEMQFLRRSLITGAHKFEGSKKEIGPSEFLKLFKMYIGLADNVCCIGYGFADTHIDLILRNWLEQSKNNKLTIIKPKSQSIPQIFAHISTQINIDNKECVQYFLSLDNSNNSVKRRLLRWIRKIGRTKLRKRFAKFQQGHSL